MLAKIKDLKETIISSEMYREYHCEQCHYISYIENYKRLLEEIVSGTMSPSELLDVQETIVESIASIENETDCSFFDKKLEIQKYRMLTNIALQIYVIGPEPYKHRALTTSAFHQDLFCQKEVLRLIDSARKMLEESPAQYIIISDLCLRNLQFGDYLIRQDNKVIGAEAKEGAKNIEIMNMVMEGKQNPYTDSTDIKHFERTRKQWERGEQILERLSSGMFFESNADGTTMALPYFIYGIDNYSSRFVKILETAYKYYYREIKIDDSISIITVNDAAYRSANNELAPPCLYHMSKNARLDCHRRKKDIYKIDELFNMQESNDGELIFLYNDVLNNPGMLQPYLWGASSDLILNMYHKSIQVYIIINIGALFGYLRKNGFKVYPKRRHISKYAFLYKNKNWIIEANGDNSNYPYTLILTEDYIQRIKYGLYTTEGLKEFLDITVGIMDANGFTNEKPEDI